MLAEVVQGCPKGIELRTPLPGPAACPRPHCPPLASTSKENCKGPVSTTRIERCGLITAAGSIGQAGRFVRPVEGAGLLSHSSRAVTVELVRGVTYAKYSQSV